jgi:hypothetical protein
MKELFRAMLEEIDGRLPSYFLVKGGRLEVAPLNNNEYNNLIANGYEPIIETGYEQLDRQVLEALNAIINGIGNRAMLLFPLAVSAIISHEARRNGSALFNALYHQKTEGTKTGEDKEIKEDKRQRRKRE